MNKLAAIEAPQGASRLGQGVERIRANLSTFNLQQVAEATRIAPTLLDDFVQFGHDISPDALDRVTGFMRGEYSLSGVSNTWVRRQRGKVEPQPLPIACTNLPVGREHPNPCGTSAPVAVETTGPEPIKLDRAAKSMLKREQPEPEEVFGRRPA